MTHLNTLASALLGIEIDPQATEAILHSYVHPEDGISMVLSEVYIKLTNLSGQSKILTPPYSTQIFLKSISDLMDHA